MQDQILLHAIFAISAQHMRLISETDETEGSCYYSHCISLLIPIISQAEQNCDENVLAGTVILRLYEEMSGTCQASELVLSDTKLMVSVDDNRCHLLGSIRLLNLITSFSSSGGLGEAASWVILRQVIYISLVSKEPMSIRLENYKQSHSFLKQDDYSWTNIMVLLFAKVLLVAFMPQDDISIEDWVELEAAIEEWNVSKPETFNLLSLREGAPSKETPFPEIWMLNASHGNFCSLGMIFTCKSNHFKSSYRRPALLSGQVIHPGI